MRAVTDALLISLMALIALGLGALYVVWPDDPPADRGDRWDVDDRNRPIR